MNSKGLFLAACMFLASTVYCASVFATSTCEVVGVEDDNVTLDCGDDASDFATGTKVKVKAVKARAAAIEGC